MGLEVVGDLTMDTGSLWHWRPNCRLWAGFLWQVSWLCPRLGGVAPLETSELLRGDLGVHGTAQCFLGGQSVAPPS